jgi:N6-adenosine-specific RNA methylase IME4
MATPFDQLAGNYRAILADPPWRFYNWSRRPWWARSDANTSRAVERHYETSSTEALCELPVRDLAADDCALFLWMVWPSLPDAIRVIEAWGFTYKTAAFVWTKAHAGQLELFRDDITDQMGLGYWTRANSEACLLATRGNPQRLDKGVRQAIIEPRREHSRKPSLVYQRIERLVGGPYLELFARSRRIGWDSWGDEVGKYEEAAE